MAQKKPRPAPSPSLEHQWACPMEGCGYVLAFTTEQSDGALDQISSHKAGHLLEERQPAEPAPQPPPVQPSALDSALAALIRSQSQTQQFLGTIAQSNQANAEAIGQLATSMAQLNQLVLDSRKPQQEEGQGPPQSQGKQWGPLEVAQVASALGIGRSGANPMDGLNQIGQVLHALNPWFQFVNGIRATTWNEAADAFSRRARAGDHPSQIAEDFKEFAGELQQRVAPTPTTG